MSTDQLPETNVVLVPGAWMGAWVWEPVENDLRDKGLTVHSVTLPGLEIPDEPITDISLKAHVEQVRTFLEASDLRNVVLVGHSYSGIVVGQVADQLPEHVRHVVYVDAFVPEKGKSMLDTFPDKARDDELKQISENDGRWPAPDFDSASEQKLTSEQARWLVDRLIDHPGRTVSEPAALERLLAEQSATYIVCTFGLDDTLEALKREPTWTFKTLESGHWPMVSSPTELAALIAEAATKAQA